jgi:hypothetical protein
MYTLSPTPIPNAPPEAPSPTMMIGTLNESQICFWQWLLLAHAPRLLNQDKSEYQSTSKRNAKFSAIFIKRNAFL